jgi:hypothetical protein
MVLTGVVADLINASRSILEDVSYRLRRMELEGREGSGRDERSHPDNQSRAPEGRAPSGQ